MFDPVSAIAGEVLTEVGKKTFMDFFRTISSEELLQTAYKNIQEERFEELDQAMNTVLENMQSRGLEIDAKLDLESASRLFIQFSIDTVAATTRDRKRLLCAAIAGALDPDVSAEMKSRFARAVLSLEPSDVIELRKLNDELVRAKESHKRDDVLDNRTRISLDALNNAGCLSYSDGRRIGRRVLQVTAFGNELLEYLRCWKPNDESTVVNPQAVGEK